MDGQTPFLERYRWIILGAAACVLLAALLYLILDEDDPVTIVIEPPPPTATHTPIPPTPTPAPLEVYVTGAVQRPESRLSMEPEARVEDAIAAAGGATANADLSRVNLAQRLRDGDHVHIPTKEEGAVAGIEIVPTPNTPRLIDLNTATQEELESLPGIGPAIAADILLYRETSGPFTHVDELDNVPGIGPATLDEIRNLVTVSE